MIIISFYTGNWRCSERENIEGDEFLIDQN